MHRRDFLALAGVGAGGLLLPAVFGKVIAAEQLTSVLDVGFKKRLADAGLNAATSAGATYCDVRVGRYLRQFVMTREDKVQNVVSTESTGVGVRQDTSPTPRTGASCTGAVCTLALAIAMAVA